MNWGQLKTIIWLRWRLLRNQWSRGGPVNAVISLVVGVGALVVGTAGGLVGLLLGAIVFNELTRLGIKMERCGIVIHNETPILEVWSTPLSPKKKQVIEVITGPLDSRLHPLLKEVYKAWKEKRDFMSGNCCNRPS